MQYDLILVQQITCTPILFPRDEDFQRNVGGGGGGGEGGAQFNPKQAGTVLLS